jgi:hypothetical protein
MSEHDKAEIREIITEAVAAALKAHPCRFSDTEASILHHAAERFDADSVEVLRGTARVIGGAASRAGQILVWSMIAAIVVGAVALYRAGILPAP